MCLNLYFLKIINCFDTFHLPSNTLTEITTITHDLGLDSRMSAMQTPSPGCSSGPSSSDSFYRSAGSTSPPQLLSAMYRQMPLTRVGGLWVRCSDSDGESPSYSPSYPQQPSPRDLLTVASPSPSSRTNNGGDRYPNTHTIQQGNYNVSFSIGNLNYVEEKLIQPSQFISGRTRAGIFRAP